MQLHLNYAAREVKCNSRLVEGLLVVVNHALPAVLNPFPFPPGLYLRANI